MTKKIFTLLTALVLSIGIGWAQMVLVQDGVKLTPEDEQKVAKLIAEDNISSDFPNSVSLVAPRKAGQATQAAELSFSWENDLTTHDTPDGGGNWTLFRFMWYKNKNTGSRPCMRLYFLAEDNYIQTINNKNYPGNGTYTIRSNKSLWTVGNYSFYKGDSRVYPDPSNTGKYYVFNAGTVTVSEGSGNYPYIEVTSTQNINSSDNIVSSGDYINIHVTVGSPKQAYQAGTISVAVKSGQSSWGTVSGGGYGAADDEIQISATPNSGYAFKQWNDGNKENPRTVVVNGDQTYTAEFLDLTNPSYANLPYNNNGFIINSLKPGRTAPEGYADWDSYSDPDFTEIEVIDKSKSSHNYLDIFFKLAGAETYIDHNGNNITGPAAGSYNVVKPGATCDSWYGDYEWYDYNGTVVIGYALDDCLGSCMWSSWGGDYVNNEVSNDVNIYKDYKIEVEHGKNNQLHMRIFSADGGLWAIVGEPASTLPTHTVTFKNYDGTQLQSDQVEEGQTPSYTGATPTKESTAQYDYTFSGWNPAITAVSSEDQVYTATFSESTREYTITFDWANGSKTVQQQVAYGTVPSYTGETPTKAADAQYTYTFDKWTPELVAVSGDATYTATYTTTTKEYAITFKNYDGTELQKTNVAYGTTPEYTGETPTRANEGLTKYTFNGWTPAVTAVTGEATYTATYSSQEVGYTLTVISNNDAWGTAAVTGEQKAKYAEGEQVTIEATKNAGYHFVRWSDGETANPRTITMDADKTLTATFAGNFHLVDTEIAGAVWYSDTYQPMVGKKTSVTIDRTFSAGWSIFSLPFDYSYVSKKNNTFRGMVYSLDEATYYNDGYLEFQFMPVSKIVANRPYILYTKTAIENPDFDNVTLKAIADGSYNEVLSGEVAGTIDFINTQSKVTIAENEPDKSIIYISNNTLYYPSPRSGQKVTMRAFRGYFHLNCDIKHAPIRFYIEDEDVTMEMQADGGDDTNTTVETKKYFDENGNLIIERNGVKFDAQGKQL